MSVVSALQVPKSVASALKSASKATGADFDYLVKTAARESAFKPDAKARTSSATGLFQFLDNTWLETVKEQGPRFGLGDHAAFILKGRGGRYYVSDPEVRAEILGLRKDPEIAAIMAGAFTQQNAAHVGAKLGRSPTSGELYMAHFLGAEGASKLISLAEDNPNAAADRYFPRAARANRQIFYSGGAPRSVADVYRSLASKHGAETAKLANGPDTSRPAKSAEVPAAKPDKVAALAEDQATFPVDTRSARPALRGGFGLDTDLDSPVGAIGPWTHFAQPVARKVPLKAKPTANVQPTPAPRVKAEVPLPPRAAPVARTHPLKIASAAFELFAEDFIAQIGNTGA